MPFMRAVSSLSVAGISVALCVTNVWAADENVLVVNPSSKPVPVSIQGTSTVTGSVTVTNTPLGVSGSVAATQSGTWNVNATLNNSPTNPARVINISQVAANIIELHCFTHRGGSRSDICIRVSPEGRNAGVFTVPEGQLLVITQLDVTLTPVPELPTPSTVEIEFGHDTAAAIAGGSFGTTNVWLVTNAQGPLQQLKFTPGLTMASGHQFYYEAVTETEMEIYGFLTPAN